MTIQSVLSQIEDLDMAKDYDSRNRMVFVLLTLAMREGWNCGVRVDVNEPEWPVVFVDLPTGQVSWHVPQYGFAWDGHDTDEKYRRCQAMRNYK